MAGILPHVELSLAATPSSAQLVREVIYGLGQSAKLADATLDDILTAVSEAVNNVVMHAYPESTGPVEIELTVREGEVVAVVRDQGQGIHPPPEQEDPDAIHGVGMAAIAAFAGSVEFRGGPGDGTEVIMRFAAPEAGPMPPWVPAPQLPAMAVLQADVRLRLRPSALGPGILARLARALAARAGFTLDRISDVELLADALCAGACRELGDWELDVGIVARTRTLELFAGPFVPDIAGRMTRGRVLDGYGSVIESLADSVRVIEHAQGEVLEVAIADSRG
jgi:anti-sigma regulatory factor (Ser/Thr protein kinase)